MNEKELIGKLNNFKNIKLDSNYKEEAKGILFNQISSSSDNFVIHNFTLTQKVFGYIAQPIWAVFFAIIIIGGGIFSVGASQYMNPSDSLYIAKLISNKAQLAITFNEVKKTKLGIKFANNHAKDITKVLASGEIDNEGAEATRLGEDFKEQISSVRSKLNEIKIAEESNSSVDELASTNSDDQIFSANSGRDNNGVQVSGSDNNVVVPSGEEEEVAPVIKEGEETASSTNEVKEENAEGSEIENAEKILDEAESLFLEKDYGGTLNKLDEAGILIDSVTEDEGEVKGASEMASSTEEN